MAERLTGGTEVTARVRGRRVTAVVVHDYYLRRRGRTRQLAQIVTGDASSLDRDCLILVEMDRCAWYRVAKETCQPTGKRIPAALAERRLAEVRQQIDSSKADARKRREAESTVEWWRIPLGTQIEVQYSNTKRWETVTFAGIVRGSGNVRYTDARGRKRSAAPKWFRMPGDE